MRLRMTGFGTNRVWLRLESLDERAMPDANQYLPVGAEPQTPPVQTAPVAPPPTNLPKADDGKETVVAPSVMLDFPDSNTYRLTLTLTTAGGKTSTVTFDLSSRSAEAVRDYVYNLLSKAGWDIEKVGKSGIQVNGLKVKDGKLDPISSFGTKFEWEGGNQYSGAMGVSSSGDVKVIKESNAKK